MSSPSKSRPARPEPSRTVVAVERAADDSGQRVHVIASSMASLGLHGLTRCGFPVDRLTPAPDLDWAALPRAQRCEHCAAEV